MCRIQQDRATCRLRAIQYQVTGERQIADRGGWNRSPALASILAEADSAIDAVGQAAGVERIDAERLIQISTGLDPERRGALASGPRRCSADLKGGWRNQNRWSIFPTGQAAGRRPS